MLRNLGIRWQILAVLALPLLVTLAGTGVIVRQALTEVSQAQNTERISSSGAAFTRLVDDLQRERAITAAAAAYDPDAIAALPQARAATDRDAAAVRGMLSSTGELLGERADEAIDAARSTDDIRLKLRAEFDAGRLDVAGVVDGYDAIVLPDSALPEAIAQGLVDRVAAAHLESTATLLQLIDATSRVQLAGRQLKTGDLFVEQAQESLAAARADAERLTVQFRRQATAEQSRILDDVLAPPKAGLPLDDLIERMSTADSAQSALDLTDWTSATDDRLRRLAALSTRVTADAHQRASQTVSTATARAQLVAGVAVVAVLVSLLMALVLARRLSEPLRRLTDWAAKVGDELPGAVARLRTPDEIGAIDLPELPVHGRDEVGRLAVAFRDVNTVALEVAAGQARLRLGVAEMFVNVARRNQTLLSRQLTFIDQLERSEENPDVLDELFRLDHLATRMRRNAESLLVLAGMESGRRLRNPILLSDVVRTATSEIEQYERIAVTVERDLLMQPHLGLSAAHLIAELLDNATTFSDPGTVVLVNLVGLRSGGMRVSVRDEGIGMAPGEISEALARIAAPFDAEMVGSPRLGWHVVGSLARRLEAAIGIEAAEGRGLLVTVDLPATLFVPDSAVDEPAGWPAGMTVRTASTARTTVAAPVATPPATVTPAVTTQAVVTATPATPATPEPVAESAPSPSLAALPRRRTAPSLPGPPVPGPPVPGSSDSDPNTAATLAPIAPPASAPVSTPLPAVAPADPSAAPSWSDLIDGQVAPDPLTNPEWTSLLRNLPGPSGDEWPLAPSSDQNRQPTSAEDHREEEWSPDPELWAPVVIELAEHPQPAEPRTPEPEPTVVAPEPEPTAVVPEPELLPAPVIPAPEPLPAPAAPEPSSPPAAPQPVVESLLATPTDRSMTVLPRRATVRFALGRNRRRPAEPAPSTPSNGAPLPEPSGRPQRPSGSDPGSISGTPVAEDRIPVQRQQPAAPPTPGALSVGGSGWSDPVDDDLSGGRSAALPQSWQAPSSPPLPRSTPPVPHVPAVIDQARRSVLASEALSELSQLSYRPATVDAAAAPALQRRTPAEPVAQPGPADPADADPVAERRERRAADVRSMLSGFKAGVERGRTSPSARPGAGGGSS